MRPRGELDPGGLWLATDALEAMIAEARRVEPFESGGVLLGWCEQDGDGVVVAGVLGPGPGATHKRTRFSPDTGWQRREIARVYEASGRTLGYLGDWHSHPGGTATPSRRDERTARRIARSRSARVPRPVILILPGRNESWSPAPYRLTDRSLRTMELFSTPRLAAAG